MRSSAVRATARTGPSGDTALRGRDRAGGRPDPTSADRRRPQVSCTERPTGRAAHRLNLPQRNQNALVPGEHRRHESSRGRVEFAAITEAWRHRSLVLFWGRRLVQKTYRRTVLGPIWIVLRPAMTYSRLFISGTILGITTGEVPYLLVLLVASSRRELFAATTYWATRALELNWRFLRRLYAPQLTMLIGALWPAMLDFVIPGDRVLAALGFLLSDGTWYPSFGLELILAAAGCLLAVGWR